MDKELYRFYSKFTKDVNKQVEKWLEQYEDLSFSKKIELERLLNIDNEVRALLKQPAIDIAQTIKDKVVTQGHAGYNSVYYSLETAHNIDLDFHFLDEKYLKNLLNNKVAGKTLSQRLYKQKTQLAQRTTDAIARGIMFGYGYDGIALEIKTVTEASYKQAARIARTESGRVRSITTQQAYMEAKDKGVDLQKQWMSTSDGRTREDHNTLNGQVVEVDEDFTIGNYKAQGPRMFGVAREDINCRCTTVSVMNGIAPSLERSGDDFYQMKYNDWLEAQQEINSGKIKGESLFPDISFEKYDETSVYRSDEVMQWVNDVTKDEKNSVGYYTGAGNYSSIRFEGKKYHLSSFQWNEYVQTGKVPGFVEGSDLEKLAREFLDNHTSNLDSALDKGKSPFDMVTMRGMSKKEFDSLGTDKQVKSYRSTTIDYDTARQYASDNREDDGSKYLVEFHIRKGSKGAYVWQYSMYPDEEEWLLPRNAKFNKVGENYIDKDGINRAVFEVIID